MKSIDYSLKDFQYEGTRTFFFRIEDAFMPGKFLDMYDILLVVGMIIYLNLLPANEEIARKCIPGQAEQCHQAESGSRRAAAQQRRRIP